jgi:putative oxidoreductase
MTTHVLTGADAGSTVSTIAPAAGRAMISALFLLSGVSKIMAPAMTIGYI